MFAHKISSIPDLKISINWHERRSQDLQVTQLDMGLLRSQHAFVKSDFEYGLEKYL